ncbi:MAG TPA: substrate-binding domain-containing protein [Chloroflexia bacterium]|jgi:ABC-type Fe3+ transport system substrate-binding protein|nr:substrate-binding domain-containing protein [Chloroflexia bacterium]
MRLRNLVIFALFLLIAGGVVASQLLFQWSPGSIVNPKPPLSISVLYSAELSSWLAPATDSFNTQKKKVGDRVVQVTIETLDDGSAEREIVAGRRSPTAWIPASSIWVNLLNQQWRANHAADLLLRSGEYGTTPMALTPMVFVMFADKANVLSQHGNVDWKEIETAITQPGGWKALGGDEAWGRVKYSQTDPSNSNSGLLAVTLAAYSYYNKTSGLTQADLDNPDFQAWMDGLASGLIDDTPPTAQQQMDDVLRYGPSKYDVVSIYESLVAQQIKNAPGRFGTDLKVFYPSVNIWSDYPFSILVGDTSTAEEKDAALLFRNYLYSVPVQEQTLKAGFRPSNPDVPLLTNNDPDNPFNLYKNAGLEINIPRTTIADTPSGDILNRLMTFLSR